MVHGGVVVTVLMVSVRPVPVLAAIPLPAPSVRTVVPVMSAGVVAVAVVAMPATAGTGALDRLKTRHMLHAVVVEYAVYGWPFCKH